MCSSYDRKAFITERVFKKSVREKTLKSFLSLLVFELHDKRPRKSRNKVVYVLNTIENEPGQTIKISNGHIGSFKGVLK